jgi:hypothetical protein
MIRAAWAPPRPQSNGEVLDTVFRLFLATVVKCLPYGLAAMLLSQAPNLYDLARAAPVRGFGTNDVTWWLLFFAGILGSLVFLSAIMLRQTAMLRGEALSMRRELADVLRRLPGLATLFVLNLLAVAAGFAALILPGAYLLVALAPAWPAFLLGPRDPLGAMHESLSLTRGHWWRSALVFAISFVIALAFVFSVAIATIALPFAGGGDLAVATAVMVAVVLAMMAVAAPLFGSLLIAIYGNLRVRRGALDLEQRIATLPQA